MDITVSSDGSEHNEDGRRVGYGYAVYQDERQLLTSSGAIDSRHPLATIWLCIDSTSVIWCTRGSVSSSSSWTFLACQEAMEAHPVKIKWLPWHKNIEGNEAADALINEGAAHHQRDQDHILGPAQRGQVHLVGRGIRQNVQQPPQITDHAEYHVKPPAALELSRPTLYRWLALRLGHRDFGLYHRKFHHDEAKLKCSCRRKKPPEHIALCRKTHGTFNRWSYGPSPHPTPGTRRYDTSNPLSRGTLKALWKLPASMKTSARGNPSPPNRQGLTARGLAPQPIPTSLKPAHLTF
ncbi:hypothetical protein N7495_009580 [Penicillium taxi]|uniref:uncharacterized protein n=1 Tax=Penicillium taxi TaxID=168475 RepID=UPI0025455F03|nr:uncharacterized protein N7495_009580 [Penicillium taxi]KAJ5885070.1 hypothetical protein N7495_009580 [Penicillium taxi]